MMKNLLLTIMTILCACAGCSSGGEVLLEYNGGVITRAQFNEWLELHRIPSGQVYAEQRLVRDRLLDMVSERLIAETPEGKNLAVDPVVVRRLEFSRSSWLAEKASAEIARDARYAPAVCYTSHICLDVPRFALDDKGRRTFDDAEYALELERRRAQLAGIRRRIAAGEDFGALAASYSTDVTMMQKGSAGGAARSGA
jgi:hypothetical protein